MNDAHASRSELARPSPLSRAASCLALGLSLSVFPFAFTACGDSPKQEQRRPQVVRQVAMGTVETRSLNRILAAPAVLEPVSSAEVGVRTQGRVATLFVDEGAHVRRGQVLAQLSSPSLTFESNEATSVSAASEAELRRARIDRDQKIRDHERATRLHAEGLLSLQQVEHARSNLAMAEAALENLSQRRSAGSSAASAVGALAADLRLVSPIDGQVARRLVEAGQVVSPGLLAFRIVDSTRLKAVAYVAENELHHLQEGQQVDLFIPALGERARGTVSAVVRELDPMTRLAKVEVALTNPDRRFASGMRAEVQVVTETHPRATAVPTSAIVSREGGDFLFVVEDGKARQQRIVVAFRGDTWTAVASGVSAGDPIVTGNLGGLRTGTTVAPLQDAAPARTARPGAANPATASPATPGPGAASPSAASPGAADSPPRAPRTR